MGTRRIILIICAIAAFAVTASLSLATTDRSPGIAWRSFTPVHYDELDIAAQLLEENCYEPRFVVPHTIRPSTTDKTAETTVDFIIVGKRIDDCNPGGGASDDLDFD